MDTRRSIASDAYKKAFWDQLRGKTSYEIRDALQVGELSEGGYTVPDKFEHQLVEALQEENIMRGLVHVITTASGDRKIPLVTNYGNASWIEEEQQIPERRGLRPDFPGRPQAGYCHPHQPGASAGLRLRHGFLHHP